MKLSIFQWVFYGVLIALAVVGLLVFATYTSKGGAGAVGTVTIWGTLPEADVKEGLLAAVKLDNTLKGVTYVEKSAETLPNDLSAAIATGAAPDAILASQEELLALAPFLQPITLSTLSANTFTKTFVSEGTLLTIPNAGGYYGVPLLVDPLVLFSNRSILASDGITTAPTTWEALTGLVSRVATLTATKQITRGLIALGTYDNVHDARGILSALFLQTATPISARSSTSGEPAANLGLTSAGSSGLAPGESVLRFYTQFADTSKVSYTWNSSLTDSQAAFGQGDLALYLGYVSEARFLKEADPNLDFDVSALPQPATASTKATYGLLYALMIPRGAPNALGAYKAATILAEENEQLALAKATGLAPATRTALGAPTPEDPVATEAAGSALIALGWLSPLPASTDTVFSTMIKDVITGRVEVQEALSTAERSLGELLSK